jgi:quercetin dioxygenase-like cupin family protein
MKPPPNTEPNPALNPAQLEQQLHNEGFQHTYVWQDGPNASYPGHTHATETAHIILDGQLTLTMNGSVVTYGPGQRCDVPAGVVHSAKMGTTGCRYIVGEK